MLCILVKIIFYRVYFIVILFKFLNFFWIMWYKFVWIFLFSMFKFFWVFSYVYYVPPFLMLINTFCIGRLALRYFWVLSFVKLLFARMDFSLFFGLLNYFLLGWILAYSLAFLNLCLRILRGKYNFMILCGQENDNFWFMWFFGLFCFQNY